MTRIINPNEVAARMTVSTLRMGLWRATRQHRAETQAENERHNTDAATVYVRVCDHPALKELARVHNDAYNEHWRLTLPSIQDGMRLLPATRQFEHADAMREFSDKHNKLVAKFLADYDDERAKAPERLGTLYEESQWPLRGVIAAKFHFETRYLAMPTDGGWSDWLADATEAAELELRDRIKGVLTRVRDNCRGDAGIRSSMFDAVRDLADLVPDLDFTGQYAPVVAALQPLTKVEADDVRNSGITRRETADKAADILAVLGGLK